MTQPNIFSGGAVLPQLEVITSKKSPKVNLGSLEPEDFQTYFIETMELLRGKPFTDVEKLQLKLEAKVNITNAMFQLKQLVQASLANSQQQLSNE